MHKNQDFIPNFFYYISHTEWSVETTLELGKYIVIKCHKLVDLGEYHTGSNDKNKVNAPWPHDIIVKIFQHTMPTK